MVVIIVVVRVVIMTMVAVNDVNGVDDNRSWCSGVDKGGRVLIICYDDYSIDKDADDNRW